MDRIRVVGCAGSGKTTTAAAIARALRIPHLELDSVHWLPEWQEREPDDFRDIVFRFAAQPRWVMDGNYSSRLGDRIDHLVDTYVWVDVPRWQAPGSVLRRTVQRAISREELWQTGNRETLSSLIKLKPRDNLVLWSWHQHDRYRQRYEAQVASGAHRWVRLRSRSEVKQFVRSLHTAEASVLDQEGQ